VIDGTEDRTPGVRPLVPYGVMTGLLCLGVVVLMRPVVTSCGTTLLGAPGDATNGGVWTAFNYLRVGGPPWMSTTPFTAAPHGEPWWHAYYITALLVFSPIWLFAHLTGSAVCGWNIAIACGFVASGLAMFALARFVSRSDIAAGLVGLAYAFAPYRQFKAEGHIAYVHTYLFPLLLLTGLLLWQRPTRARVACAAVVLALVGYTDGYYILLGAVAFGTFHLSALAWSALIDRVTWPELRPRLLAVTVTAVGALVLLVPVLLTFLTTAGEISSTLTRQADEIANYAARPSEYLLPARSHPVFERSLGAWQDRHLHGSNFGEASVFLGWSAVVAAAATIVSLLDRSRRNTPLVERSGMSYGLTVGAVAGTAVAGLLFSFPPSVHLGPVALPMPSGVVSAATKIWRVYARFFIVVHPAVLALAAMSIARVIRSRVGIARPIAVVGLGILMMFESIVTWTPGTWDYRLAPRAYHFVAEQSDVDVIAEWPLAPTSLKPDHEYLGWVPVHEKQLVNVLNDGSLADQVARGIYGLADPDTAAVLRRLGTDLVLVHRINAPGEAPASDFERVASFSYNDDAATMPALARRAGRWAYLAPAYEVDVYRLQPGPIATSAIAVGAGFYDPEGAPIGVSSRWMRQQGELTPVRLGGRGERVRIAFLMGSVSNRRRNVVIEQSGATVWSGDVSSPTTVQFDAAVGRKITFRAYPGPEHVPDGRELSVTVSGIDVVAVDP
jgi:hypothetical protein